MAPALAVFLAFALLPIGFGLGLSLYRWDPVEGVCSYTGLTNFVDFFGDPTSKTALRNNLLWIGLSIAIQVPLALVLAAGLSDASRYSRLLRTLLFSPLVIPAVAVGLLFSIVLDSQFGALNSALTMLAGREVEVGWLADPKIALYCLIAVACWQYTGFHMMVLLAGIQGIPYELHEAAAIDGAGWWQRLVRITLPLLRRVLLVDLLLVAVGSIKVFDIVWVMTEGGPNNATEVLATHMYSTAIMSERMGAGSAIAVIMLAITLAFSLLHSRLAREGAGA